MSDSSYFSKLPRTVDLQACELLIRKEKGGDKLRQDIKNIEKKR